MTPAERPEVVAERRLRTKAGTNLLHALVAMTGARDQITYFEQVAAIEDEARAAAAEPLRGALKEAVGLLSGGRRGYVGDHYIREIQVKQTTVDRLRATLEETVPSTPEPALDVVLVKQAIANIARRHGITKDAPTPLSLMRIYGYSAAPAEMDAEIAREYAALTSEPRAAAPQTKPEDAG